jgi:hypothetical protein
MFLLRRLRAGSGDKVQGRGEEDREERAAPAEAPPTAAAPEAGEDEKRACPDPLAPWRVIVDAAGRLRSTGPWTQAPNGAVRAAEPAHQQARGTLRCLVYARRHCDAPPGESGLTSRVRSSRVRAGSAFVTRGKARLSARLGDVVCVEHVQGSFCECRTSEVSRASEG